MIEFVRSTGPDHAKILIIGEAPGRDEEREGLAFVGSAGRLLNWMLKDALLDREQIHVTNVVRVRPPGNDITKASPCAYDPYWLKMLQKEIIEVDPNVIVPLGNVALNAVLSFNKDCLRMAKEYQITKMRGSVLECQLVPGKKVIPSFHPAAILRQWHWKQLTVCDLEKVRYESNFPQVKRKTRTGLLFPKFREAVEYMDHLANRRDPYCLDIELSKGDLACIGLGASALHAMCIPFITNKTSYWSPEEEQVIWRSLDKLLRSNVAKIGQNLNFDLFWLILYGIWPTLPQDDVELFDTMIMFNLRYAELPKGLDNLCTLYSDIPFYKDEGKHWLKPIPDEQLFSYNIKDIFSTYDAYDNLVIELEDFKINPVTAIPTKIPPKNLLEYYKALPMPLLGHLLMMSIRGVRVDLAKRAEAKKAYEEHLTTAQAKLDTLAEYPVNVNSSSQMKRFLYIDLGFKQEFNRKTGSVTSGETALLKLKEKAKDERQSQSVSSVLEVREIRKMLSTYLGGGKKGDTLLDVDLRMRCSYDATGTDSGRISSYDAPNGRGGNLQNVPDGICREVLIPDEGYIFVSADLSQAEARIVAYDSQDKNLMEAFESGLDVHKFNASILFNKPYRNVTDDERFVAKHLVHACNYGTGPQKFAEAVNAHAKKAKVNVFFTKPEAAEKIFQYFEKFPGIREWHAWIEEELRKTMTLYNLFGRPHIFFDHFDGQLIRKGLSYRPQSTNGDLANMALVRFCNKYKQFIASLPVHDSLTAQGRKEQMEEVRDALKDAFDIPLTVHGRIFRIPLDFKAGYNWGKKGLTIKL